MNLYHQYLSLLQMFFHHEDVRKSHQEKSQNAMQVREEDLLRDAA